MPEIHRIEVGYRQDVTDALSNQLKKRIASELGYDVETAKIIDVYTIKKDFNRTTLSKLGNELLADPVTQVFACDSPLVSRIEHLSQLNAGRKDNSASSSNEASSERGGAWFAEVGYKPGVTDNVGRSAALAIEEMTGSKFQPGEAVFTSRLYQLSGRNLSRNLVESIVRNLLANELVQQWAIMDQATFHQARQGLPLPEVRISREPGVGHIDLGVSSEELLKISQERSLALNLEEMLAIKDYFSRPAVIEDRKKAGLDERPTDAELEALAQTWSEHCKHKIFNAGVRYKDESRKNKVIDGLFDTCIKGSTRKLEKKLDWVVSTLWDNSGVMKLNDDWLFAFKGETHNSPSNEEPYGGALTGIVGVYRDPMGTGKGCRLIYGAYGFCTGNPFYSGNLRPRIHPRRLLEGVRKGVEDGGNKHGVPTPYGLVFFDDGYMGKPAIYVLAAGLIPAMIHGEEGYKKSVGPGDLIVMCGGRVGIDGIHGATQSSMEAGEWITAGHVQIGDPFVQKKMHDFLNEARDIGLYEAITDNGAGGLSSSVGEMAKFSNGFELELDKVPLKYHGLDPWQILLSESQERMTLAVRPEKVKAFLNLAKKHEVESTVTGRFTNSGKYYCSYKGKTVTCLDMEFVHEGVPRMELEAEWLTPEERGLAEPSLRDVKDHSSFLEEMLARPNICSREYIVRQFDHEVQGTSIIKPLVGADRDVPGDAVVLRPIFGSKEGIAIAAGLNPKYSLIDTYHMASCALDEAIRKIIAVGGSLKQIALNDNFCWPSPLPASNNPDARYKMAQLVRANQALYDYTLAFKTPCISGKDSMSLDGIVKDVDGVEHRISALPTIQFSAAGKISDVSKCVTMDLKKPGDLIYILGMTFDELGASEYYEMRGALGRNVPVVRAKEARSLYNALSKAIEKGLVASAHGCYRGGLAIALAMAAMAGGYGIEVDLGKVPAEIKNSDKILYSESASRFVVSVSPERKVLFEKTVRGNVFSHIGYVREDEDLIVLGVEGKPVIRQKISRLKEAWKRPLGV